MLWTDHLYGFDNQKVLTRRPDHVTFPLNLKGLTCRQSAVAKYSIMPELTYSQR